MHPVDLFVAWSAQAHQVSHWLTLKMVITHVVYHERSFGGAARFTEAPVFHPVQGTLSFPLV